MNVRASAAEGAHLEKPAPNEKPQCRTADSVLGLGHGDGPGSPLQRAEPTDMRQRDGLDDLAALRARFTPLKGKRPYRKGWPTKGVSNAETARQWLQKGENVGLITGQDSGVVVIDVDPRNGGDRSLHDLEQALGKLPDTLTCQTGGGGLHLYFKWYPEAKAGTPAEGIDFKAKGGCVVLPPSVHPDTGALYQWEDIDAEIAELPEAWREAMAGRRAESRTVEDDGAPISEGKRNTTLFKKAWQLYSAGESEQRVLTQLAQINTERCLPPLEVDEVDKIARQAYRYKPTEQSPLTRWQQNLVRSDLKRREKLVGFTLSTYADSQCRNCFPSQELIAAACDYRRQSISEATRVLEDEGWVQRIPVPRPGAHGWSYSYILTVPDVRLPDNEESDVRLPDNG